jgi:hypothetical protein
VLGSGNSTKRPKQVIELRKSTQLISIYIKRGPLVCLQGSTYKNQLHTYMISMKDSKMKLGIIQLTIASKRKYLGINLTKDVKFVD